MKRWAVGLVVLLGVSWGVISLAVDFDGDGKADIAIFRPSTGMWAVRSITNRVYYGHAGDIPIPGDYDNSGYTNIAIFRPSTGLWSIRNLTRVYFGATDDQPLAGGGQTFNRNCFYVDHANCRVGIGAWSPTQRLHVSGYGNERILVESLGAHNVELNLKNNATTWAIYNKADDGSLRFFNGGDKVTLESSTGNVGIGGNPYYKLYVGGAVMLQGQSSSPLISNFAAGIYAYPTTNTELWAMDGMGNTALLSPHDPETGEWIFYSKNLRTGRVVRVDMERLVRKIEELTGEQFMVERWEKPLD